MDRPSMATPDGHVAPERRRHRRVRVPQPSTIDLGLRRAATLLDVSESGVGVQAPCHTMPGITTSLSFTLPALPAPIKCMGAVTWTDASGHMGLEFRQLSQEDRERLARWITRQQDEISFDAHASSAAASLAPSRVEKTNEEAQAPALEAAMRRLSALTSATGAAVALENGGGMVCVASWGNAPGLNTRLDPRSGLSGECVRTATVVRCEDTERDPRIDRLLYRRLNLRSMAIVPVFRQGRVVGVIEVFSNVPHAFDSTHVELLTRVAELVGGKNGDSANTQPLRQSDSIAGSAAIADAAHVPVAAQGESEPPKPVNSDAGGRPAASPAIAAKAAEPEDTASAPSPPSPSLQVRSASKKATARRAAPPLPRPNIFRRTAGAFSTLIRSVLVVWFTSALLLGSLIAYRQTVRVRAARSAVATQASRANNPPPSSAGGMEDLGARVDEAMTRLRALVQPGGGAAQTPSEAANPATATAAQHVSGGQVLEKVEPAYPEAARKQRLKGPVFLRVQVGKNGHVQRVEVLRGNLILASAAKAAVRRWRYEPFRVDGEPIEMETVVSVAFPEPQP